MTMDVEFGNKNFCPKINVSYMAQTKMDMYVDIAQKEVGWYGLVERTGESTFYIHDVYMIEQEVNAATTEIDPMGLAKLKTTLWKSGVINVENQSRIGLYLWGHSHVNMSTGPSGQDNSQLESIITTSNPPFFIRLIQNKKGEKNIVLFINNVPMLQSITIKQPVWFAEPNHAMVELMKQLEDEMKEKVKDKVVCVSSAYGSYYGGKVHRAYDSVYGTYGLYDDDDDYYGAYGAGITTAEDGVPEIGGTKTLGKVARKTAPSNSYKKLPGRPPKVAAAAKKVPAEVIPPEQVTSPEPVLQSLASAHKTTEAIIAKYSRQADFPNITKDDLGIPDKVV